MITSDTAIRHLAFAQSRTSVAEAMMNMFGRQQELEQATAVQGQTDERETTRFTDMARELRDAAKQPALVDKKV